MSEGTRFSFSRERAHMNPKFNAFAGGQQTTLGGIDPTLKMHVNIDEDDQSASMSASILDSPMLADMIKKIGGENELQKRYDSIVSPHDNSDEEDDFSGVLEVNSPIFSEEQQSKVTEFKGLFADLHIDEEEDNETERQLNVVIPKLPAREKLTRFSRVEESRANKVCIDIKCNTEIPSYARFCIECGKEQISKFCSGCGYTFTASENFCPRCGNKR